MSARCDASLNEAFPQKQVRWSTDTGFKTAMNNRKIGVKALEVSK